VEVLNPWTNQGNWSNEETCSTPRPFAEARKAHSSRAPATAVLFVLARLDEDALALLTMVSV
jgi:hypothetical protein